MSIDLTVSKVGEHIYTSNPKYLYLPEVMKFHIETDSVYSEDVFSGILKENANKQQVLDYLHLIGAKLTFKVKDAFAFRYEDSIIILYFDDKKLTLEVLSNSDKAMNAFNHIKNEFLTESNKDFVFSIIKSGNSLSIRNIGKANSPLIEDNYNRSVIDDLDYVKKSFSKSPPNGRICILNGPAGTGKTHLIRSLLSDIDSIFLIIQSSMLSSMDNPDFLPLLLNTKTDYNKSITLIIEDGDASLVPRKADNMSSIASLLNLSDGIIGSIIDIRMIISTNSDIKEIDKAIMRPGRLCKLIEVNTLEYSKANKVYKRLSSLDNNLPNEANYSLAEIYALVNNHDMPSTNSTAFTNKKIIGFSNFNNELMNSKVCRGTLI